MNGSEKNSVAICLITNRRFDWTIEEHKHCYCILDPRPFAFCHAQKRRALGSRMSAIGKHLHDAHNQRNKDPQEQFNILKKCRRKFECLIYEMLFIQEMKPELNTQSDSIKAKLFST